MTTETEWHLPASAGMLRHPQLSVSADATCYQLYFAVTKYYTVTASLRIRFPAFKHKPYSDSENQPHLAFPFLNNEQQIINSFTQFPVCSPVPGEWNRWSCSSGVWAIVVLLTLSLWLIVLAPCSSLKPTGSPFITFMKAGADGI